MKHPRYSDLKETKFEWLPRIPAKWHVVRFSFFISFQEGPGIMAVDFREEGIPLLRIRNVQGKYVDPEGSNYLDPKMVERTWKKYRCRPGDLLISCSATTGLVAEVTKKSEGAIAYTGLIRLWPQRREIVADFIRWLVVSGQFLTQVSLLKTGATMQHYGPEHLGKMRVTLPSVTEQQQIADFLDWKTSQIDALLAKKQQLLDKLKEQRISIITQAVTKGITPNAPMRDSGVAWIGEVPKHWDVQKLKFNVSKIGSGVTPSGGAESYEDNGIPLLRSQNVHFERLKLEDVAFISPETHFDMKNSHVEVGDVLLNITGASIGRCNFADATLGVANVNQHVCIIRPEKAFDTQYLHFLFWSEVGQIQIALEQSGSGREGLNFVTLKNFLFPLPDIDEQKAIAKTVQKKLAEMDKLIGKVSTAVKKLDEYRNAIITAATTGQIDVREVKVGAKL